MVGVRVRVQGYVTDYRPYWGVGHARASEGGGGGATVAGAAVAGPTAGAAAMGTSRGPAAGTVQPTANRPTMTTMTIPRPPYERTAFAASTHFTTTNPQAPARREILHERGRARTDVAQVVGPGRIQQGAHTLGETPRYLRLPLGLLYGVATLSERVYRLFRLDGEPPFTCYTICTLGYSQTLNIEKAERELGYRPIVSLRAGIRKYAKGER